MSTDMNALIELEKRAGLTYSDLEKLLAEFYSPIITDNVKKKEIGDFLMKFSTSNTTWELCLLYLSHTNNELMLMFCASVLENSILQQGRTPEEKSLIRLAAYKLLTSSSSPSSQPTTMIQSSTSSTQLHNNDRHLSLFIRNKLVKLIVAIARIDWPKDYPYFFDEIFTLLSLEDHVLLGLTFVQMSSEEFISPREDVLVERKMELVRLFSGHIPDLLNIFTGILLSAKRKAESIIDNQLSSSSSSCATVAAATVATVAATAANVAMPMTFCLDAKCASVISLTLECLGNMFTWIDPTNTNNNSNGNINCNNNPMLTTFNNNSNNNGNNNDDNNNNVLTVFSTKRDLFTIILELAMKFSFDRPQQQHQLHQQLHQHQQQQQHQQHQQLLHKCSNCCRATIATNALSCVCELLSRNFNKSSSTSSSLSSSSSSLRVFPMQAYLQFVAETFEAFYNMLLVLLKNDPQSERNILEDLDDGYLSKMIEYLSVFIQVHMQKFVDNQNFPIMQFLALFIQFTFKQTTNESYFQCLAIWGDFVNYVSSKVDECGRVSGENVQLIKYQEVLLTLFIGILNRIQFKTNQSQLEMLDDDVLDDDFKTEWQFYLMENIDVIIGVARLYPTHVFQHLAQPFHEALSIYLDLERFITTTPATLTTTATLTTAATTTSLPSSSSSSSLHNHSNDGNGFIAAVTTSAAAVSMTSSSSSSSLQQRQAVGFARRLNVTAENDCRRLHCSLRDLSTMLQIQASLIDHFVGEKFEEGFDAGCLLMERLITMADYGSRLKLYELSSAIENVLEADFIEVHAQTMAVLKTCCVWLAQFYSRSRNEGQSSRSKCDEMIKVLLSSVLPLFLQETVPEKILLSASQLLLSLLTVVCPVAAYNDSEPLQRLYIGGILVNNVPPEVELITYRALTHYLLTFWPSSSNQDWDRRGQLMTSFVNHFIGDYLVLGGDGEMVEKLRLNPELRESARPMVEKSLTMVTDVVNHLDISGTRKRKQMSYACFEKTVQITLNLLPVYISNPETSGLMLQYFLVMVQTHRIELGAQSVAIIIQSIMHLFTKELVMQSLTEEKSTSHQIVDKFLQILTIVTSEPGQTFKKFLSSILDLSLYQIYPVLAERPTPDVKTTLFSLFYSILKYNWKNFFPSSLLVGTKPGEGMVGQSKLPGSEQYFSGIMQALGQSFLQPDVELFRHNLNILESLNDQFKLYDKPTFKHALLSEFLSVLLHSLIHKSHDLLRDDITTAIFNMAAVDFECFYSTFVPRFLATIDLPGDACKQKLVAGLQRERDLPTFSKNLQNFVNDLRFYKLNFLSNSS